MEERARPISNVEKLRPIDLTHGYTVELAPGDNYDFTVRASLAGQVYDLTVTFPAEYDDCPEAVPSELLDHVQTALERMRQDVVVELGLGG